VEVFHRHGVFSSRIVYKNLIRYTEQKAEFFFYTGVELDVLI